MQKAYISHPASGAVRVLDGTAPTKIEGTNFAWWEQQCDPNQDQIAFFENILVPPNLNLVASFTMRLQFRQIDPGAGSVVIDPRAVGLVAVPPDRDTAPVSLGAITTTVPGTVGQEKAVSVTLPQAALVSGSEILLAAARLGSLPADTFTTGKIAFTRVDFEFEVNDPGSKWLDGVPPNSIYYGAGPVGINTASPGEWLHVAGGVRIGNTVNTVQGNIRYTGSDFEGYTPSGWASLTTGGGGEINTASNLGSETVTQRGLFTTKAGVNLPFKRLKAGTNVTFGSDANYITINATGTGGETNTASNRVFPDTVSIKGLFYQKSGVDLEFKALQAGTNITLAASATTVTISATSGEVNTGSNRGTETATQKGVFSSKVGVDLEFKRLKAGTNVTLGADADYVTINATGAGGGEANTASNRVSPDTATQKGLFYQKNGVDLEFKVIKAGTNITLSADTNEVTINATGGAVSLDGAYNNGSTITVDTGAMLLNSTVLTALDINQNAGGRGVRVTSTTTGADGFYASITTGDALNGTVTTGRAARLATSGGTARTLPLTSIWYASGTYASNTGIRAIEVDCTSMTPNSSTASGAIYLAGSTSSNAFYAGLYADAGWDYGWYSGSHTWMAADRAVYFGGTDVTSNRMGGRIWLGTSWTPDAFIFDTGDRTSAGNTDQILIETGNAADGNSGNVTVRTGTASSTRGSLGLAGGSVAMTASTGAVAITALATSGFTVSAPSQLLLLGTSGLGASAILRSSGARSGTVGGVTVDTGSQSTLNTGNVVVASGLISAGISTNNTGSVSVVSGSCYNGSSGFVQVSSGNSDSVSVGSGNTLLSTGAQTYSSSTGSSGLVSIFSGSVYRGTSGIISITSGAAAPATNTGNTGAVYLRSGNVGGVTGDGNSGAITIQSGAIADDGNSGNVFVGSGAVSGTGTRGYVHINASNMWMNTNGRMRFGDPVGGEVASVGAGSSNPSPVWPKGSIFMNTTDGKLYASTGAAWVVVGTQV